MMGIVGSCWKNVSEKQKDNYFKDLKKTCTWDEEKLPTEIVRQHWDTVAPKAYSDFVCRVKKAVGTPKENKFVKYATLTKWKEYWARPEVIAKSEIARRNRNSEVNGPGTGPAIHHGGSRNVELQARDLAIANGLPIDSTSLPTTLRFHCKNGVWTDTRAKKKYDEVQLRFAEERAPLPGTNEERVLTKEREQEIWAEVFEANDRGRVIGQGCLSRLYVKRRKRVSQISCTPLQTQQEARIRELEERLKAQGEERKAQEEERKVQEELRAAKEAKRNEDYEMLKREVLKFGAIFKSLPEGFSSQFDSSSSALH